MPSNPTAASVPTSLKLKISASEDATVIRCSGRLTVDVAAKFKDEVRMLIPEARCIVLDLSEVTFMDSSGLGAVVGLYVTAKKANCDLRPVNFSKRVRELLGMSNLLSVFEPFAEYPIRMI